MLRVGALQLREMTYWNTGLSLVDGAVLQHAFRAAGSARYRTGDGGDQCSSRTV